MKQKVLSVKQPYSYLICSGIKPIENRTWKLPEKYRDKWVLIHASADRKLNLMALTREQYNDACDKFEWNGAMKPVDQWPRSAIIGAVKFSDCVINHPSIWAEKTMFDYGSICYKNKCEHLKTWSFGHGYCESCELVGQSYVVETIPDDCLFKKQMPKPIYNLKVEDAILFDKPILNVKGKLGFWDYDLPEEYEKNLKR